METDPMHSENEEITQKKRGTSISPANLLAISHFFSAWGDRMWMFAVGLYLVELTPNSLRLTAMYGLVVSLSVVLFASMVGNWVDANGRIKVVRISLIVQNVLVCMSALVILAILYRKPGHPVVLKVCEASIIILGSLANLASQANTIAVERDWVVVVSGDDRNLLAVLNAKMRRIDLTCAILAPVAVGLIMSLGSNVAGIIFICAWNVLSFFAEYYLLNRVYKAVPRLQIKNYGSLENEAKEGSAESIMHGEPEVSTEKGPGNHCCSCLLFVERFKSFYNGWRVYFSQNVALAGTSLAFIYLTVLGFSSVTTGYAYTQRLSGAIVSVCFGIGSLMGIIGTFLYPRLRKKVGLLRTGLISFLLQWSMLIFCVVSIWTPGSPSDLYASHIHLWQKFSGGTTTNRPRNYSLVETTKIPLTRHLLLNSKRYDASVLSGKASRDSKAMLPSTMMIVNKTSLVYYKQEKFSYISISLLMTGLLLSRIGLWMTDLTITQLLQENVAEKHRGIVSGTQSAFNAVLDMLHYVLTIVLPSPNQFGILTLISFAAVTIGYFSYILFYFRKSRDIYVRERGIGSVSSIEWKRENFHEDYESNGFTLLEEDEEEIVRGTLTLQEQDFHGKDVL